MIKAMSTKSKPAPQAFKFSIRIKEDSSKHGVLTKSVDAINPTEAWTLLIKDLKSSGILFSVVSLELI